MSRFSRSQMVHLSLIAIHTVALRRENKKPCLLFSKQGGRNSFSFFVTCLPPVVPESFRGSALDTRWIGQGETHNRRLTAHAVSLSRPASPANSWLICSCKFSLNVIDIYHR